MKTPRFFSMHSLPASLLAFSLVGACALDLEANGELAEASTPESDWLPADAAAHQGYFWDAIAEEVRLFSYVEVDGLAISEGDIVLGPANGNEKERAIAEATAVTGAEYRWPDALVPYTIDADLPDPWRVTDAIDHWQAETHIRFVQRTSSNAAAYPDYVRFMRGAGCTSYVGRNGGEQAITLAEGCSTGNTIHEIGHALGLLHEHGRQDRDDYVRILHGNIQFDAQIWFIRNIRNAEDVLHYDYDSIMHYGRYAFSKNGLPTIEPLGGQPIGQRVGLSDTDVAAVELMYSQFGSPL